MSAISVSAAVVSAVLAGAVVESAVSESVISSELVTGALVVDSVATNELKSLLMLLLRESKILQDESMILDGYYFCIVTHM